MARSCLCERLMKSDLVQYRLRQVPMAARWLWLELVKAMLAAEEPGVLRVLAGPGLPASVPALVSALAFCSETEAETHLGTLFAVGLLQRREDGAIALPAYAGVSSARANAARINGLRGGRPRKDGSPPRRQAEMMLPIPGGRVAGVENPGETQPVSGTAISSSSSSAEEKLSSSPETQADWLPVAEEAAAAVGLRPEAKSTCLSVVRTWMAAGATREMILAAVTGPRRADVGSLRYFDARVREAIAAAAPPPPREKWRSAYEAELEDWRLRGCPGGIEAMPREAMFRDRAVDAA